MPGKQLQGGVGERLVDFHGLTLDLPAHRGRDVVPSRTDCRVQALAARRWLSRHGLVSRLVLGAREPSSTEFKAHA